MGIADIAKANSGGVSGPGAARPRSGGGGTSAGGAGAGTGSTARSETVANMQRIMSNLSTQLSNPAIQEKVKGIIGATDLPLTIGPTSRGTFSANDDGVWGRNTKAALDNIKNFIDKNSNEKIRGIFIKPGTGNSPYKEMKPEDLESDAKSNINNLFRLFEKLGLDTSDLGVKKRVRNAIFDKIAKSPEPDDARKPEPWPWLKDGAPVNSDSFRDFLSFFAFVQSLNISVPCVALEEIAQPKRRSSLTDSDLKVLSEAILEGSIVRLSQVGVPENIVQEHREGVLGHPNALKPDLTRTKRRRNEPLLGTKWPGAGDTGKESLTGGVERDKKDKLTGGGGESAEGVSPSAGTGTTPAEAPPLGSTTGLCPNQIDFITNWFQQRARNVYAQIYGLFDADDAHPNEPERQVTQEDVDLAKNYAIMADGMWRTWGGIRGRIIEMLRDKGLDKNPTITVEMLNNMVSSGMDMGGGGAGRRRHPGGRGSGAFTIPGEGEEGPGKGPLADYMRLDYLGNQYGVAEDAGAQLRALSASGQLPTIDLRTWRTGNWIDMALRDVNADTNTEKLRLFPEYAASIRNFLQSLYRNWQADGAEQITDAVSRSQDRLLSRWEGYIRSMIAVAQRQMAGAITRVSGGEEGSRRDRTIPDQPVYQPMNQLPTAQPAQQQFTSDRASRISEQTTRRNEVSQAKTDRAKSREARREARKER